MTKNLILLVFIATLIAAADSQLKTDFSGTWESKIQTKDKQDIELLRVEHRANDLYVEKFWNGELRTKFHYIIDKKTHPLARQGDTEFMGMAEWKQDKLHVRTIIQSATIKSPIDVSITVDELWSLKDDQLLIESKTAGLGANGSNKTLFSRLPTAESSD